MDSSRYSPYLGTRWSETGASLLPLLGPGTELRITAPPRDAAELTNTSRILRISWEPAGTEDGTGMAAGECNAEPVAQAASEKGNYVVLLSHR